MERRHNFKLRILTRGESCPFKSVKGFANVHIHRRLGDVAPQKEYASRYSNPNHPARQGLIGLVTGGKVNPQKGLIRGRFRGNDEYVETADELTARKAGENGTENVARDGVNRDQIAWQATKGSGQRGLSKMLRQDVLYLMVVNMPSEEELEEVRRVAGFNFF